MSLFRRAAALVGVPLVALLGGTVMPAGADGTPASGAVYVLGNQPAGNEVLVFDRSADGTLTAAGHYATGGNGTGGGLGSQGAVAVDDAGRYVYAVNAGSGTVTSFRVTPSGLRRIDTAGTGGAMPTSLTVRHGLLYVLNAGGAGSITGFTVDAGDLSPLPGSTRALSAAGTAPAQVSFSPDGRHQVVAERATQKIDVFDVDADGVAGSATVFPSAGPTPFGFGFDNKDHVIVSEAFGGAADASAVSSYDLDGGVLTTVSASVPTTETAACWIAVTANGRFAYAGNAGTASVTGYEVAPDGSLRILDGDGKTALAAAGVTDLAVSVNSRFLYGRLGNGTVASWAIGADGSLESVGTVPGLPAGAAGIAAR
jgi:6-phosphogluconolactonase